MNLLSEKNMSETTGAIPRNIRDFNRRIVLKAAAEHDVFSAAEIASEVMLSRQSVMKAVNHFQKQNLIVSLGKGNSTEIGGKKPELYSLRPPQRPITILHRTHAMVFQMTDMTGRCLDTCTVPIDKTLTDEGFIKAIRTGAEKLLTSNAGLKETLYGVAMAVGGQVDPEHRTMYRSMYFRNLTIGLPVYDILKEIFSWVPCIQLDCIGRMAGQAILLNKELIRNNRQIFTLYIDRGITGCFFVDGKLQTESTLMMLEVGHMVLDAHDDELCTCGRYGCAESLISLNRMRRSIAQQLSDYPDSCLNHISPEQLNFDILFDGSRKGDMLCVKEVRRLAEAMGHLLRNIFLVCGPGLVVLMGNFSNADQVFDETLKNSIKSSYVYTLQEGKSDIMYDTREVQQIEALGCAQSVIKAFFDDDRLYV